MHKCKFRLAFITIRAGHPELKWWAFECVYCTDTYTCAADKFWHLFPKGIIYI